MAGVDDLTVRVAKLQAHAAIRRARNRAAAPEFTAFVDALRAKFGDVKVRYVRWPDGTEEGKKGEPGMPVTLMPKVKQ